MKAKKNKLKELREKQKQDIEQTKMLLQAQTLATPEEQKAHVQKLVENADFDSAADIFGADFIRKDRDLEQVTRDEKSSNKTEKTDIEATISKMRLATEADAERLGNVVASKLIASPVHYIYQLGSKTWSDRTIRVEHKIRPELLEADHYQRFDESDSRRYERADNDYQCKRPPTVMSQTKRLRICR